MVVEVSYKEDIKIIKVNGQIDFENYMEFKNILLSNAQENEKVVLDLAELSYINSMGLSALVNFYSITKKEKGNLKMCCLNDNISKLFRITKLDKVIDICNTLEDAVQELRKI